MSVAQIHTHPDLSDLLGVIAQSPKITFVLDSNLQLTYCNPAWRRFALENQAPELAGPEVIGIDLRHVIPAELLPFYLQAFAKVEREANVWECLYECSSPERFRKFQMRIHLLAPSGWFLVTNSIVIEHPHPSIVTGGLGDYLSSDSLITTCMHCRCSRRVTPPSQWDFVPAHLDRNLANISHGLCPMCLEYFYPKTGSENP